MSLKVHYKVSDSQCMQVVSIYISQQVFDSSRERSCKSVECCFSHFTKTLSRQYKKHFLANTIISITNQLYTTFLFAQQNVMC